MLCFQLETNPNPNPHQKIPEAIHFLLKTFHSYISNRQFSLLHSHTVPTLSYFKKLVKLKDISTQFDTSIFSQS